MIVVPSSMPEEESLNIGEGVGDHVCDFRVEVTASGDSLLLHTLREQGNPNCL